MNDRTKAYSRSRRWIRATLGVALLAVLALTHGCGTASEQRESVATESAAVGEMCGVVPAEYIDASDGCDCPADGDQTCDPDCADGNAGGEFCGCEFCYGDPPAGSCGEVPSQYIDQNDGCDCPANGSTTCDPDCADANGAADFCGCDYCYGDPPAAPAYVPPAENAAFGIPGTPPSTTLNSVLTPQPVGQLPGGGGVRKDGSYRYTIPLAVPLGRGGMAPSVSLEYSSHGGDGPLGVGWSLRAGQSAITRCDKRYAAGFRNLTTEARVRQTENVQFATTDALCLDGERLELVAGTNGRPGSEYRTETDSFAKIAGEGGCATCEPDLFKVFHKNGLIGTYRKHGGINAAGTTLTGMFREGGTTVTMVWALTRLEDRSGNGVEYVWTKDNATASGQNQSYPRLTDIKYTTCTTAGGNTCPYGTTGLRKITFGYQTRPDSRRAYVNGVRLDSLVRLSTITVYGNAGTSAVNWTYTLAYKQSAFTNRSLLESVQQCAGTDCLPKTTFSWQDTGKNFWEVKGVAGREWNLVNPGQSGFAGTEPNASEVSFLVFDADGDGAQDVVIKEWPSSAIDSGTGRLHRTVATLGAGPVDYLLKGDGSGYFNSEQAIDLEGDGAPAASSRCAASPTQLQGEISDLSSTFVVDLDMDGRDELFAPLNTGCPFQFASGATTNGMRMTPSLVLTPRNANTSGQRVYAVLNYDRDTRTIKRRTNPLPTFNSGFWDNWKYNFADLTGDGLPEVMQGSTGSGDAVTIGRAWSNAAGEIEAANPEITYVALGPTAGGYDTGLRFSWQQQNSSSRTPTALRVLDQNGDGRSEILQLSYDGSQRGFWLNGTMTQAVRSYRTADGATNWVQPQNLDGTGGTPPLQWPAYPGPNQTTLSNGSLMSWRFADLNGDGLKDALYSRRMAGNAFPWFYRINTGNGYLAEQEVSVTGGSSFLWTYGQASEMTLVNGVVRVPQEVGLRIADMNGDGLDDLVLLDTANGSIVYNNGAGFDAPVNLPARAPIPLVRVSHPGNVHVWPATHITDLDGDGMLDWIELVRDPSNPRKSHLVTLRRVLYGHDVIHTVTDGLSTSPAESVEYHRLGHPGIHSSDTIPKFAANGTTRVSPPCRFPARCVSAGVVVSAYRNARTERKIDTYYRYVGARVDVAGRGSLGFRQVRAVDNITGLETVDTYEQGSYGSVHFDEYHLYPMLGTPTSSVTLQTTATTDPSLAQPDGKRVRTTNTWMPTFGTGLPVRTTRTRTSTTIADVEPLSSGSSTAVDRVRHETEVNFDQYGNVTTSTETSRDLGTLDTTTSLPNLTSTRASTFTYFPAQTSSWFVGLPSTLSITSTIDTPECSSLANCGSVTQQVWFEYESNARRLLRKITREPLLTNGGLLHTILERDPSGLVRRSRLRNAQGVERVVEVDFEANGIFPKAGRNPLGHVSFANYNVQLGALDREFTPNGTWTSQTYDKLGRLRRVDTSDGGFTAVSFAKQTSSLATYHSFTVTTATGNDSKTFLDERGRVFLTLSPGYNPTAGGAPSSTTMTLGTRDALGNVTQDHFYKHTQSYSSALGATLDSLLNAFNAGSPEVVGGGVYDIYGRPADITSGDAAKTGGTEGAAEHQRISYPRIGESRRIDSSNNESRVIADARGNKRRVYEGKAGNAASLVPIDYAYSALGKLARIKPKDTPAELFVHDVLGRPNAWYMGGSGNIRTWQFTAFDQVDRFLEANELSVKFTYDALGRMLTRTEENHPNASERTISYHWDTSRRRDAACQVIPSGGFALGELSVAKIEGGHTTTYAYDPQGRACSVRAGFADDPALTVGFGYDGVGRLNVIRYPKTLLDPGGLDIKYEFATNGELRRIVDLTANPDAEIWRVTDRHALGMPKQAVNTDGLTSSWQYQTNLLRVKRHDPMTGASQAFAYFENGQLKSRTFNTNAQVETYGYGSIGRRLTDYTRAAPAGTTQIDADYTYSIGGDIKTLVTNTAVATDLGQVGTQTFAYGAGDPLGGTQPAPYSDLLTSIDPSWVGASGTTSYGYDSAGRQTSKFVGGVRKRSITSYNTYNLPTAIDLVNGSTLLSRTTLDYDADGVRVAKRKLTVAGNVEESVLYFGRLFERQRFLNQRTTPATEVNRALFRVYADHGPVAEIMHNEGGSSETQFISTDEQGSVNFRTQGTSSVGADGAGGPGGFRGYNPFGKRWSTASSAAMFSSIGFTGHIHDDDLGLINMNGRIYDTEQQRFISRDPMVLPYALGGTNAYSYVINDPTNNTDPSGFSCVGQDGGDGTCPNGADGALGDGEGWVNAVCDVFDFFGANVCGGGGGGNDQPEFCRGLVGGCTQQEIDQYNATHIDNSDGRIPPPPSEPPPGPPPGPPGEYACDTWHRCTAPAAADAGPPAGTISGPTGIYFGDAYQPETPPAASPPPQSSPPSTTPPSTTGGQEVVKTLAWLGGWQGTQNYVPNGGFNYGAAGGFMARMNDALNATNFSTAVAGGLMSFVTPAEPALPVATPTVIHGPMSRVLLQTPRNLQKFFTKKGHGSAFGLTGNWNPSRAVEASRVIHEHINGAGVQVIAGAYRGKPAVHFVDVATGRNVVADLQGNFITGYGLDAAQLETLLRTGHLF